MRLHVFPRRPQGTKVAEHVLDAFRARMEVVHNGINYLREEQMITRNVLERASVDLYVKGVKRRNGLPWIRSDRRQRLGRMIARATIRGRG